MFFPFSLFMGSLECLRNVTRTPPGGWGGVSLCFALSLPQALSSGTQGFLGPPFPPADSTLSSQAACAQRAGGSWFPGSLFGADPHTTASPVREQMGTMGTTGRHPEFSAAVEAGAQQHNRCRCGQGTPLCRCGRGPQGPCNQLTVVFFHSQG